jgi:hypothetical protein
MFTYESPFYNELYYEIERKWQRKLTDHEKHLAKIAYEFGRYIEMENEIRILDAK